MSLYDEKDLRERLSRGELLDEVYRDMGQRLSDKELFVLMHLASLRIAYQTVKKEDNAQFLNIDDADTVDNIAAVTKLNIQFVRKVIYALSLMGLIRNKGREKNAQSWIITPAGGRLIQVVSEMENDDKRRTPLEKRFLKAVGKKG